MNYTGKLKLTTREAAALGRIYGEGDYTIVATRKCRRECNRRRWEREHAKKA